MTTLANFAIACLFSFAGSIPPGTLNLGILQLGLDKKINAAWRFALAAALVEYPYAWLAVVFENAITSNPVILENFQLLAAVAMILFGVISLIAARKPTSALKKFNDSGFRRGIVLSVLNPLAIPFWIGITAYLKSRNWIDLSTTLHLHAYLAGVALGALVFLIAVAYLAQKASSLFTNHSWVRHIPAVMLLALGAYGIILYLS